MPGFPNSSQAPSFGSGPAASSLPKVPSGARTVPCCSRTRRPSGTFRLAQDGSLELLREQTRAANGQTFGPGGSILFCEQNGRRVSQMDDLGKNVVTLAETWSGARLNSPNDIVCRSDGLVYFTDPPYGVEPSRRSLHFQGLFALDLGKAGPR